MTTWDNFELRTFNHDLGRWSAPDPYAQFHSPYLAMANDPVSKIDPNGGYVRGNNPLGGFLASGPVYHSEAYVAFMNPGPIGGSMAVSQSELDRFSSIRGGGGGATGKSPYGNSLGYNPNHGDETYGAVNDDWLNTSENQEMSDRTTHNLLAIISYIKSNYTLDKESGEYGHKEDQYVFSNWRRTESGVNEGAWKADVSVEAVFVTDFTSSNMESLLNSAGAQSGGGGELLSATTYGASNSTTYNSGAGTPYFNNVSDQKMFPGVAIYETPLASGGITLVAPGKNALILVHPNSSLKLKQHEYGHYLDMKNGVGTLGGIIPNDFTFNVIMGIPSLINAMYDDYEGHRNFYSEISANQQSYIFFLNQGTLASDYDYPTTMKK
jgi:hypothetical protein